MLSEFLRESRIAYFSMEIALRNEIPTYSGGLGVLAGDTLRSAADLALPLVAVSLASRAGYFRQTIDAQGRQIESADLWDPAQWAQPLPAKIAVRIEGREVWVRAWLYIMGGCRPGREPIILLDTDLDENHADDRTLTHYLYGGDAAYRLKQEIVLGIGGVRMLHALGFEIRQYHLNEGHSALLGVELLRRFIYPAEDVRRGESMYDIPRVRELCNFTTHTPIEAGQDKFSYALVRQILGEDVDLQVIKSLAGDDALNMTRLALNLSDFVNGVAKTHAVVSEHMFPGYHVHAITNGVHAATWTCPSVAALYDRYLPGWCHEPAILVRADQIPDDEFWAAHVAAKVALLEHIKALTGVTLDLAQPLLGFARRMTAYKRPDLLFSDLDRLKRIAQRWPFQLVLAGKAHPRDDSGKRLIELLHEKQRELAGHVEMVFLPNYDLRIAQLLVAGTDVWLNTPLRPLEASGTSGMKAVCNGVPNLSVLDGWWAEGCIEGVTGWAVGGAESSANGDDAQHLYEKLEQVVLPLYYQDRPAWLRIMKGAVCKDASFFNSHRMMRRYATEAYLR